MSNIFSWQLNIEINFLPLEPQCNKKGRKGGKEDSRLEMNLLKKKLKIKKNPKLNN